MKITKKILALCLILTLIVSITACSRGNQDGGGEAAADEPIHITFGHTDSNTKVTHQAALQFADYMNKQTDGKIIVDVYPNGELGDDNELIKGVMMGTVDIFQGTPLASFIPEFAYTSLPFVYNSYDDWYTGTFEKGGLEMAQQTVADANLGMVLVDYMFSGSSNILSSVKNYSTINDFKGFKLRITPTDLNAEIWGAVGANPTAIAWGEVYTSLTQKTVDGIDHTLSCFYTQKFYENCKYVTITNHIFLPVAVIASESTFEKIPAAYQDAFMEGLTNMCEYQRNTERENENSYPAMLEDEGCSVTSLSQEVRDEMKAMMEANGVYDFQREVSGADVVDAFIATGGNS